MASMTITNFTVTNRSDRDIVLMLEPEGDVVHIPCGKQCQIRPERTPQAVVDCEIEYGAIGEITLYLPIVKEVYIDGTQLR